MKKHVTGERIQRFADRRLFADEKSKCTDAVGLDVVLSIEDNYAQHRPGLPEGPRILLKKMITEGRLGVKSGRGFYNYQ